VRRLGTQPAVVFTTAYDQYAVKAFEANGTDYLLKPISAEALDRAIAKLERNRSVDPPPVTDLRRLFFHRLDRLIRRDSTFLLHNRQTASAVLPQLSVVADSTGF
jgi:DNA-binding LytR/AlgR family response regulator